MFKKSIRAKLFASLLLVSLVPLVLISIILYSTANKGLENILHNNILSSKESITAQLNNVSEDLLNLTQSYAENENLIQAFRSGDQQQLIEEVEPIFTRLQTEHQMDVLEFGNTEGEVVLRGHDIEKYGDDKSDIPAVQEALAENTIAGFEFGSSGLSVRAFAPIVHNDEVIGTLQTGLDGKVIQSITDSLKGVQLSIMNTEGETLVSSDDKNIGEKTSDSSLLSKVNAGEEVFKENDTSLHYYMPLEDPTQSEVIGIIKIDQDASAVKSLNDKILLYVIAIGLITVVIVSVIAFFLSSGFTKPIQQVTSVMDRLANGFLNNEVKGEEREDELGQLSKSASATQANLREMIEKIARLSGVVKEQSAKVKQASREIDEGSGQTASTMQELASGSEQQAQASTSLSEQMADFSSKINRATDNGVLIQKSSNEVSESTKYGNQLMENSVTQMNSIYDLVKDSVQKVESLDKQSDEISRLVNAIEEIAEQTNLLALNAAIEAARAGEHGKGFAVVADEVRKLAEQVSASISDITGIVESVQSGSKSVAESLKAGYKQVDEGTQVMEITGSEFKKISQSVEQMVANIENITGDLEEINENSHGINSSIENIASVSEESAAGIEQTTASVVQVSSLIGDISTNADSLAQLSEELEEMVKQFKTE